VQLRDGRLQLLRPHLPTKREHTQGTYSRDI
jgi:hypothetical protein